MIYFLETEISNTKKVNKSLENVYGIGKKKINLICKKLGIAKNLQTSDLLNKQVTNMSQHVSDSKTLIGNSLKKENLLFSQKLVNIKSFRGLRKIKGLPVRGQRTHTNAKTSRKF